MDQLIATELVRDLRVLIDGARSRVATTANRELTLLHWRVGQRIQAEVLGEERAPYGQEIVATVSRQLAPTYGRGFERKNLLSLLLCTSTPLGSPAWSRAHGHEAPPHPRGAPGGRCGLHTALQLHRFHHPSTAWHRALPRLRPHLMLSEAQLDAYFERLGIRRPGLNRDGLDAIALAHVCSIPFENLDVLLPGSFGIELQEVFHKLVVQRRGGYCFEQNTLLLAALQALGFEARALSARVRLDCPRDRVPARTHVFVEVMMEERWLLDVGVGAVSSTAALRWVEHELQETSHDQRRFVRDGDLWFHQKLADDWFDICDFTGETMHAIDRELGHWYTSSHPQSHFGNRLLVARANPDGGRTTLLNHRLTLRAPRSEPRVTELQGPEQLLQVLAEHFGLEFEPGTRFVGPPFPWI